MLCLPLQPLPCMTQPTAAHLRLCAARRPRLLLLQAEIVSGGLPAGRNSTRRISNQQNAVGQVAVRQLGATAFIPA